MASQINLSSMELEVIQKEERGQEHVEEHLEIGEMIKSFIYGGVDGTVNTTIIILSGVSSGMTTVGIFGICVAAIVAGALDMACCDYVSAKAEIAFIKQQEDREFYEVQNMLEDQKKQIISIYTKKGFSIEDSSRLAELFATSSNAFVNIMMLEELQLVSIKDPYFPLKCGLVTFISFAFFGFVTIIPYCIDRAIPLNTQLWPFVLMISTIQLMSLGMTKATILRIEKLRAITEIFLMGVVATGVGYSIGLLFPTNP